MKEIDTKIKVGDYIIIQRQKYTKLHKFGNLQSTAALGKEQLQLRNIEGQNYFSTFKIIPNESVDGGRNKQRNCSLEICTETDMRSIREKLNIQESGADNRNIIDDSQSQNLSTEDIFKLKDEYSDSSQIVEKIVENSKTFQLKTEYSQEKYLKKKEKKYFEYVQIRQPTLRLLADIFYRQDVDRIMGIRIDTLSQIISYSGVSGFGNYLLYESGTNGLLPAAFLNSIGAGTDAKIIHMHPGNVCQKQAVLALNLPSEQINRCVSVNIYSVLREYYQGLKPELNDNKNVNELKELKRKADDNEEIIDELETKKIRKEDINETTDKEVLNGEQTVDKANINEKELNIEDNQKLKNQSIANTSLDSKHDSKFAKTSFSETETGISQEKTKTNDSSNENENFLVPKWQIENKRACELMREKFDALVVVAKEHPNTIVKSLIPFLKPSRPIVIFNMSKEILQEMYVELKSSTEITGLHLTSNWLRMLQILPNRTHPEVSMSTNGGYLLCGYSLR